MDDDVEEIRGVATGIAFGNGAGLGVACDVGLAGAAYGERLVEVAIAVLGDCGGGGGGVVGEVVERRDSVLSGSDGGSEVRGAEEDEAVVASEEESDEWVGRTGNEDIDEGTFGE